jgi:asparagine synthetase B (glutamine-hydrolysing)
MYLLSRRIKALGVKMVLSGKNFATSIRLWLSSPYVLQQSFSDFCFPQHLTGEGSDEIFGGYLYFYNAPDRKSFYEETQRRLQLLHTADCLRANKSTAAWGLEVRVPFLDKDFIEAAMSVDPADKMCIPGKRMEKYVLRKAFDLGDESAPATADDSVRGNHPSYLLSFLMLSRFLSSFTRLLPSSF